MMDDLLLQEVDNELADQPIEPVDDADYITNVHMSAQ
jgi:hypothetical protein